MVSWSLEPHLSNKKFSSKNINFKLSNFDFQNFDFFEKFWKKNQKNENFENPKIFRKKWKKFKFFKISIFFNFFRKKIKNFEKNQNFDFQKIKKLKIRKTFGKKWIFFFQTFSKKSKFWKSKFDDLKLIFFDEIFLFERWGSKDPKTTVFWYLGVRTRYEFILWLQYGKKLLWL